MPDPPQRGWAPPNCLHPSERATETKPGLGKGLAPYSLHPDPEYQLRLVLDVPAQRGRLGPGKRACLAGARARWGRGRGHAAKWVVPEKDPITPATGDQEWACRGLSQLGARLLTNISVFSVTGDSDLFAAGGFSSPLCSFPIYSSFSQTPLFHPQFSSSLAERRDAKFNSFTPCPLQTRIPHSAGMVQPTGVGCSSLHSPPRGDTRQDERWRPPPHP